MLHKTSLAFFKPTLYGYSIGIRDPAIFRDQQQNKQDVGEEAEDTQSQRTVEIFFLYILWKIKLFTGFLPGFYFDNMKYSIHLFKRKLIWSKCGPCKSSFFFVLHCYTGKFLWKKNFVTYQDFPVI